MKKTDSEKLAACVAASDHAEKLSATARQATTASEADGAGSQEHGAAAEAHAAAAAAHKTAASLHADAGNDQTAAHHGRMAATHDAQAERHLAACSGKVAGSDDAPRLCLLIGDSRAAADGLKRIPVALVTRGFKGKQQFKVTRDDLAQIVANFQKRQADVVLDYEHSTLNARDGQPTPTAGWLKRIDDAPDANGVLWGWVEYTEQGAESVAAKDYKYVSPVIEWGVRDKRTGEQQGATVTSIALTKQPLFENLPSLPLVACDGWSFERGDAVEEREHKDVKITKVMAGAAGRVRLVADDNTETEFAVDGLRVLTMADVKRGSDGRFDFASLPQGDGMLVASDVLRAMDVQTAIDAATKDGKITPAQRGFYEKSAMADFDGFKTLVASMAPVVPLGERGTAADGITLNSLPAVEAEMERKVAEKRAAHPQMPYGQALKLVASENPTLIRTRAALQRRQQMGGR